VRGVTTLISCAQQFVCVCRRDCDSEDVVSSSSWRCPCKIKLNGDMFFGGNHVLGCLLIVRCKRIPIHLLRIGVLVKLCFCLP